VKPTTHLHLVPRSRMVELYLQTPVCLIVIECTLYDCGSEIRGMYCLHLHGQRVNQTSRTHPEDEIVRSSGTSINIYQITRCNLLESSGLHNHRNEYIKSHMSYRRHHTFFPLGAFRLG
jgi:hypothetical protein